MKVIIHPVMSEKAVRLMESNNALTLIVNSKANKAQIKQAVQNMFKVRVIDVKTLMTTKNDKKAYVKLSQENVALDVGAELGMI